MKALVPSPGRELVPIAALPPAVIELVATPPSSARRIIGITMVLALGFMLGALFVGRYDVVAVAPGKVVFKTKEKVVSPMELGLVRTINVADGQTVKAGEVLIELDPTVHVNELEATKAQLDEQRLLALEARAMLANPPQDSFVVPDGISPEVIAVHQRHLQSRVAAFHAQLRTMERDLGVKVATLGKLVAMVPNLRRKEAARRQIVQRGAYPLMSYLDDAQILIAAEQDVRVQEAAVAQQRELIKQTIEEFWRDASSQLVDAELRIKQLQADYAKAKQLLGYQVLTAPGEGMVEQLAVHTPGGVVKPGDPLLVIVPAGDELQIEALVANLDIGFVKPGQSVVMKVDTYPYEIYGFLTGLVDTVSLDGFVDAQNSISFPVRVRIDQDSLQYNGAKLLLTAGMSVSVEIKTSERRLVDYLASIVLRLRDESFRER
jgi:hemolysin D